MRGVVNGIIFHTEKRVTTEVTIENHFSKRIIIFHNITINTQKKILCEISAILQHIVYRKNKKPYILFDVGSLAEKPGFEPGLPLTALLP